MSIFTGGRTGRIRIALLAVATAGFIVGCKHAAPTATVGDPAVFTTLHMVAADRAYSADAAAAGDTNGAALGLSTLGHMHRYFGSTEAEYKKNARRMDVFLDQTQRSQAFALVLAKSLQLEIQFDDVGELDPEFASSSAADASKAKPTVLADGTVASKAGADKAQAEVKAKQAKVDELKDKQASTKKQIEAMVTEVARLNEVIRVETEKKTAAEKALAEKRKELADLDPNASDYQTKKDELNRAIGAEEAKANQAASMIKFAEEDRTKASSNAEKLKPVLASYDQPIADAEVALEKAKKAAAEAKPKVDPQVAALAKLLEPNDSPFDRLDRVNDWFMAYNTLILSAYGGDSRALNTDSLIQAIASYHRNRAKDLRHEIDTNLGAGWAILHTLEQKGCELSKCNSIDPACRLKQRLQDLRARALAGCEVLTPLPACKRECEKKPEAKARQKRDEADCSLGGKTKGESEDPADPEPAADPASASDPDPASAADPEPAAGVKPEARATDADAALYFINTQPSMEAEASRLVEASDLTPLETQHFYEMMLESGDAAMNEDGLLSLDGLGDERVKEIMIGINVPQGIPGGIGAGPRRSTPINREALQRATDLINLSRRAPAPGGARNDAGGDGNNRTQAQRAKDCSNEGRDGAVDSEKLTSQGVGGRGSNGNTSTVTPPNINTEASVEELIQAGEALAADLERLLADYQETCHLLQRYFSEYECSPEDDYRLVTLLVPVSIDAGTRPNTMVGNALRVDEVFRAIDPDDQPAAFQTTLTTLRENYKTAKASLNTCVGHLRLEQRKRRVADLESKASDKLDAKITTLKSKIKTHEEGVEEARLALNGHKAAGFEPASLGDVRVLSLHPRRSYDLEDQRLTQSFRTTTRFLAQAGFVKAAGKVDASSDEQQEEASRFLSRISKVGAWQDAPNQRFGWTFAPSNLRVAPRKAWDRFTDILFGEPGRRYTAEATLETGTRLCSAVLLVRSDIESIIFNVNDYVMDVNQADELAWEQVGLRGVRGEGREEGKLRVDLPEYDPMETLILTLPQP